MHLDAMLVPVRANRHGSEFARALQVPYNWGGDHDLLYSVESPLSDLPSLSRRRFPKGVA